MSSTKLKFLNNNGKCNFKCGEQESDFFSSSEETKQLKKKLNCKIRTPFIAKTDFLPSSEYSSTRSSDIVQECIGELFECGFCSYPNHELLHHNLTCQTSFEELKTPLEAPSSSRHPPPMKSRNTTASSSIIIHDEYNTTTHFDSDNRDDNSRHRKNFPSVCLYNIRTPDNALSVNDKYTEYAP
eukprot:GDKJ01019328.1.p1 GENE.GDKJ01019328.1~~GDKJ01019328.1.p1  ORF type:complete len:184 (-),score=18.67 GDKJ01019328.1:104-655(-)